MDQNTIDKNVRCLILAFDSPLTDPEKVWYHLYGLRPYRENIRGWDRIVAMTMKYLDEQAPKSYPHEWYNVFK